MSELALNSEEHPNSEDSEDFSESSDTRLRPLKLHITEYMVRKSALIELVLTRIPLNQFNLPEGYYRPDLLPNSIEDLQTVHIIEMDGSEIIAPNNMNSEFAENLLDEQKLMTAYVQLKYDEGFPATPTGEPFWSILDFEPPGAHLVFQAYLESGTKGLRMLSSLSNRWRLEDLLIYFQLYYWGPRAKSYDLFKAASRQREMSHAINTLQDDHLLKATKLMDIAMTYVKGDDFEELLTPKVAIDLAKLAFQIQRLSTGLPAMSPAVNGDGGSASVHASVEVILRQLVGDQPLNVSDEGVTGATSRRARIRERLLSDPETAAAAQELILRLTAPKPKEGAEL